MTPRIFIAYFEMYFYLVMGLVALGIEIWAFVDSLRHKPEAYIASGKRTKGFWMAVTGGATVVGLLGLSGSGLGLFGLIAVVAASVYLADVRPEVKSGGTYRPW